MNANESEVPRLSVWPFLIGDGLLLEIRVVKPSGKRQGQTVTQDKMDVCKACWVAALTGKVGKDEPAAAGKEEA